MKKYPVFVDDRNIMTCRINNEGRLSIEIGPINKERLFDSQIALEKADVKQLIKVLTELEKETKK